MTVEDIYTLAEQYSAELSVPVKVLYSGTRGNHLSIPTPPSSNGPLTLPSTFLQTVLQRSSIAYTTEEISSLSDRAAEAIDCALRLTHELIQDLLTEIRTDIDSLFALTDSVALLDML